MLDIKFIRDNKDIIKEAARKKRVKVDIDTLIEIDNKRLEMLGSVESMRAEQNTMSNQIATTKDETLRQALITEMRGLKEQLKLKEDALKEIMQEWHTHMLKVPNVPDMSVPEGKDESENVEVKKGGTIPEFSFEPKDHIEIMQKHKMIDLERGVKAHGFRGYFLINDGARLSWAIWNYARDFFKRDDATEVIAPALVRKEHFYGTGHLPNEAEDLFETQDHDYLSGTAEVPMMAYYSGETLLKEELPKRFFAFSPCYRREAGSYGKDIKGLIRVHEFYKFEQLILCEANHAESERLHEEITAKTEAFIESLGLAYHRTILCTGDLSASKVKQYEIELWVPTQNTYREIASSSYYHDFQTRRFNIKYKDEGKNLYTHSLNNTAIPTPRILVSLVENFQQADGSIKVPDVLVPYFGKSVIG